jgi:RNA polymerase sigma factor (sigma-70 family)
MLNDKLLVWQMNRGSVDAIGKMYSRYKNELVSLAVTLCKDRAMGEDVVHDVFCEFVHNHFGCVGATDGQGKPKKFKLTGTLKGYLSVCVANKARNLYRQNKRRAVLSLDDNTSLVNTDAAPDCAMQVDEAAHGLHTCLDELPDEQREVIVLHVQHNITFKEIASNSGNSINTIQSRYRYGMAKLQIMLKSEPSK